MLKQFDSSYAGHIDLENVGYGGTPINDRRYPNKELATALSKAESMAKLMDRLGYGTFWMAEHHFQPEGTECIPNVLLMALHLTHLTQEPAHRLRLQHHADVASASPGRGLRDGGHPVERTGRVRGRPRLSHA